MPKPESTDLIIGSGIVVTGTTIVKHVMQSKAAPTKAGKLAKPKSHPIVGPIIFGTLLTGVLLAIGLVAPGFSKGLAWLLIVGAFFVNGPTIVKLISGFKG